MLFDDDRFGVLDYAVSFDGSEIVGAAVDDSMHDIDGRRTGRLEQPFQAQCEVQE